MVVLHVFTPDREQALRKGLERTYRVTVRRKPSLVVELVARGMVRAVIVDLIRPDGRETLSVIRQVRDASRVTPILGYVPDPNDGRSVSLLPQAVYLGLSGVITTAADVHAVLSASTQPCMRGVLATTFQNEIDALPPGLIKLFCTRLITDPGAAASYAEFVHILGATSASVYMAFRRQGYGKPQQLFSRVRVLAAITLLLEGDRHAEEISTILGYRSGDVLRRSLMRETERSIREGYDTVTLDRVIRRIRDQLNRV